MHWQHCRWAHTEGAVTSRSVVDARMMTVEAISVFLWSLIYWTLHVAPLTFHFKCTNLVQCTCLRFAVHYLNEAWVIQQCIMFLLFCPLHLLKSCFCQATLFLSFYIPSRFSLKTHTQNANYSTLTPRCLRFLVVPLFYLSSSHTSFLIIASRGWLQL